MTLHSLLGVKLPIIQAPMAGVQDSELAISVAKAGGLGSLPCAMLSLEQLESELETIRCSKLEAPINLNFFCHTPPLHNSRTQARWRELLSPFFQELGVDANAISASASRLPFSHEVADLLEPYCPPILSFHFGLPSPDLLNRVKAWGGTILSSATTLEEALWLEANGADAIILQGLEAGGHRGMFLSNKLGSQINTKPLFDKVHNRVRRPLITAGGISTASDVSKAINSGAVAVQVGTAYLLCNEAKTSQLHRDAIRNIGSRRTQVTNLFSGRPARGIVNRAMSELGAINSMVPEFPLAANEMSALRKAAEANNSDAFSPLWCGQNTSGCQATSASNLTAKLSSEL